MRKNKLIINKIYIYKNKINILLYKKNYVIIKIIIGGKDE